MNKLTLFLYLIGIILVSGCTGPDSNTGDDVENIVKENDHVSVDYIGELEDGTIFDTSIEDVAKDGGVYNPNRKYEPLSFTAGAGQMISGFDRGVIGMAVGEEKTLVIPPEEAYGESSAGNNHPLAGKTLIFKVTLVSIGQE